MRSLSQHGSTIQGEKGGRENGGWQLSLEPHLPGGVEGEGKELTRQRNLDAVLASVQALHHGRDLLVTRVHPVKIFLQSPDLEDLDSAGKK